MSGKRCQSQYRLSSGGAVRRNSLRCAPFGPPTVSCVLAPARTCLRQAPPTSRGRGLATSAVPHHLADDMAMKTFTTGKRCKKPSLFSPFQKIQTNGVKSGRFLHSLVRSCGCLGQASGQVLHGHLHDTDRIALKISHLDRWQYSKRFRQHGHRRRLLYCASVSGVTYCNMNPESCLSNFRGSFYLFTLLLRSDSLGLGSAVTCWPEY